MGLKVAVFGATGAVGKEILTILDERLFPADEMHAIQRPLSRRPIDRDRRVFPQKLRRDLAHRPPRILGLPDAAVREAYHRVRTAFRSLRLSFPRGQVVVNLATNAAHAMPRGPDRPSARNGGARDANGGSLPRSPSLASLLCKRGMQRFIGHASWRPLVLPFWLPVQ